MFRKNMSRVTLTRILSLRNHSFDKLIPDIPSILGTQIVFSLLLKWASEEGIISPAYDWLLKKKKTVISRATDKFFRQRSFNFENPEFQTAYFRYSKEEEGRTAGRLFRYQVKKPDIKHNSSSIQKFFNFPEKHLSNPRDSSVITDLLSRSL